MDASAYIHPHALVKNHVYTVVGGSHTRFPTIPPQIYPESESTRLPIFGLNWVPNEYPYLFFIPKYKPFYGPLFDRLTFDERRVPVECDDRGLYALHSDIMTEWVALERNLRAMLSAMHHLCGSLPPLFRFWAFPKRFGYEMAYKYRWMAEGIVLRSRDAFVPLMAALSFFLLILLDRERTIEGYSWRDKVLNQTGIHYEWLAALEYSVVADMAIPRVGGLIDMRTCQYQGFLKIIVEARLEFLCLHWGSVSSVPIQLHAFVVSKGLFPNHIAITNLLQFAARPFSASRPDTLPPKPVSTGLILKHDHHHSPPSSSNNKPSLLSPPSSSNNNPSLLSPNHDTTVQTPARNENDEEEPPAFPPVEQYSDQKPGEHWRKFFERREKANAASATKESKARTQARQQRAKHAERHEVPGKQGATVFYWENVNGFRVRRAGGRDNYNYLWSRYGRKERRYDSFKNQWDLCTEFGDDDANPNPTFNPDPTFDDSDDDYDDDHVVWYKSALTQSQHTPGTSHNEAEAEPTIEADAEEGEIVEDGEIDKDIPLLPEPLDLPDHNEAQYSSIADLTRMYGGALEDAKQVPDATDESFEDRAYYRFGFVSPSTEVAPPRDRPRWPEVRKFLGNGVFRDQQDSGLQPSSSLQDILCTFFGYMDQSKSLDDIPAELYDARQDDSDLMRLRGTNIRVRKERFNASWYYLVRCVPDEEDQSVYVGLMSAATLFDIIRRPVGSTLDSVIEFLLDRHITFRTFIRGPQHPPRRSSRIFIPRYLGLGFRPPKYKPDHLDYKAYVYSRDRLLRSSRGCAALLAGGIVARLAKEVVDNEEVLYGPSDTVFTDGLCCWNGESSSMGYWDDNLTQDELDTICGVYKVATGQLDNGRPQTTDLSWWPKPSIWEQCGLWVGYWSEDCEKWFKTHLATCLAGTASLKNPGDWRHSIRYSKPAACMAHKNEDRAVEALHRIQ